MAASPLAAALLGGEGGGLGYLDPAIASATPDLQLGQQLLQQGLSTAPASPWQALARVAQAGAGTYLQRGAISQLSQAYAHNADTLAKIFPPGTAIGNMLNSDDPITKMQGVQLAQKAAVLRSEPYTLSPGQTRFEGSGETATNTNAQSEEGKLQQDIDNANRRRAGGAPPPAPAAPAGARPAVAPSASSPAGVPLGPPRAGGIESVIGMGPATPQPAAAPAGVPTTAPSFNDRFDASRPSGIAPTSPPANPLQGAIDVQAQKAAATTQAQESAKAGVEFGDLLGPQSAPKKGPGGTEALTTTHGTLVPPLTEQAPLPKSPAEAKPRVEAWQKTQEGWHAGLQPGYQAEQRLNTIANAFKSIQTGKFTTERADWAAKLQAVGLDSLAKKIMENPEQAQLSLHENYMETLQQLKATQPRFSQMEFRVTSENKEHPELKPEANLQMLSEDIAQLRQSRDLPLDFIEAQKHGWRDPQSFEQAWLRQNPLKIYVDQVRKDIGPLKGMPGNEAGSKSPAVHEGGSEMAAKADPSARFKELVGGGMSKEQAFAKMHAEGF